MSNLITIHNGLAVYQSGEGTPLLLLPYPHASTLRPMGEDKLAVLLVGLGYRVITDDHKQTAPPRAHWLQSVRKVDYRSRLGEDRAQTLLCVGRYDPQTPLPCSQELKAGIPLSRLVIFEESGHSPFIEEPEQFLQELTRFFGGENTATN